MTRRTWLYLGAACSLVVMAVLEPMFAGGVEDFSALGPRRTFESVDFDARFAGGGLRSDLVAVGDTVYFPVSNPPVLPIVQRRAPNIKDRQPPPAPVIIEPADHQRLTFPPLVEDLDPCGAPATLTWLEGFVVTGIAEPHSSVKLTEGGGLMLGWSVADDAGRWSIAYFSLDAFRRLRGEVTLTATATDASGNVSAPTAVQVRVVVGGADDDWLQALFTGARPSPGR